MIMFGSFLPSLLVGVSTTNFTRAREPTLSWNQLHQQFSSGEIRKFPTVMLELETMHGKA